MTSPEWFDEDDSTSHSDSQTDSSESEIEPPQDSNGNYIYSFIEASRGFTRHEVYETCFLLRQKRLPAELAALILNHAQYWVDTTYQRGDGITITQDFGGRGGDERYLHTAPIGADGLTGLRPVKRVVFTIESRDQGWSSYPDEHGTYTGSWTWFEAQKGDPSILEEEEVASDGQQQDQHADNDARDPAELPLRPEGREIVRNIHAGKSWHKHVISWAADDEDHGEWVREIRRGEVIILSAHARFPGWANRVKSAKITVYTAAIR
ncbi:hypothetical protein E2P81_ATG02531 [Venturia nashicola]|uniref:Uncharacterized protein n=1 Tax=Venturia nashicola TaxID=86259 RepID=A0A4Z1P8J6_9PEZI|nr:hypothetical protein E6O75_ATG02593 [Venturia nashicola]TLD36749.1 hypothetical protein E2P81_ATG02531 [Venturia nashicola]